MGGWVGWLGGCGCLLISADMESNAQLGDLDMRL